MSDAVRPPTQLRVGQKVFSTWQGRPHYATVLWVEDYQDTLDDPHPIYGPEEQVVLVHYENGEQVQAYASNFTIAAEEES